MNYPPPESLVRLGFSAVFRPGAPSFALFAKGRYAKHPPSTAAGAGVPGAPPMTRTWSWVGLAASAQSIQNQQSGCPCLAFETWVQGFRDHRVSDTSSLIPTPNPPGPALIHKTAVQPNLSIGNPKEIFQTSHSKLLRKPLSWRSEWVQRRRLVLGGVQALHSSNQQPHLSIHYHDSLPSCLVTPEKATISFPSLA